MEHDLLFKTDRNSQQLAYSNSNSLDLHGQIEELKAHLRDANDTFKERDNKFNEKIEFYESQLQKAQEETKQSREKYDKLFEVVRKLQKTNSNLEDKLLTIVQKYEDEIKNLKEEIYVNHSKLVEAKLIMSDLEDEKDRYKHDCKLAVHLLQCKPSEFISHTFNTLPLNLKERLGTHLTQTELNSLECAAAREKQNASFKLPIFQPTAAAAIMYNIQNTSLKQQQRIKDNQIINNSLSGLLNYSNINNNNNNNQTTIQLINNNEGSINGRISSALIAQLLAQDTLECEAKFAHKRKNSKLFTIMCIKCKQECILVNDKSTQTMCPSTQSPSSSTMYPSYSTSCVNDNNNFSFYETSSILNRSKSVANNLQSLNYNNNNNNNTTRQQQQQQQQQQPTLVFDINECENGYSRNTNN